MKQKHNRFSLSEWTGILLMMLGIGLGFYGSIAGSREMSAATRNFSEFLEDAHELSEIQHAIQNVTSGLSRGTTTSGLSSVGFWLFLTGIGVFVISRRHKWNSE